MENRSSSMAYLVCFIAALYAFYSFFQMNILNTIGVSFLEYWGIPLNRLGDLSAFFFYADAIFLLPAGFLLDLYPTRRLILIAMSLSVCGAAILLFAPTYDFLMLGRSISGLGHSFAILGCFRLVSQCFPVRRWASMMAVVTTIALCGGLVAQTPFAHLIELVGWRQALAVDVIAGVVILCLLFFILKRETPPSTIPVQAQQWTLLTIYKTLRAVLKQSQNWLGGMYACILSFPLLILGSTWGSLYVQKTYGLSSLAGAWSSSLLFLGMMIGSPCLGYWSDHIRKRKPVMFWGNLVTLVLVVFMFVTALPSALIDTLFFMIGLSSSAQIVGYPLVSESNAPEQVSSGLGFSCALIILGGALSQTLFGFLMRQSEHFSQTHAAWHQPFFIPALILPISIILNFWVIRKTRETNCQPLIREW